MNKEENFIVSWKKRYKKEKESSQVTVNRNHIIDGKMSKKARFDQGR